ncbi:TetR family transcriptional regulator [Naasia aerilata]|uniref:TetR family transcriptional regulator n=1 Tax=Naasia aerilata TaxID=1162966 RepID=A0ABM8GCM2_9MICO|nr:TetR family transcriptional regulator [Naasia aerilata]BDZ45990.1 TetR family transcriptional regulator [Naasia aerilata]
MTSEQVVPRRGRGRPRAADAGDSRERILAAASAEFSRHGYEAVSLRSVARAASVDAALVHHYFEDKADLFTQAIGMPLRPDRVVKTVLSGPREDVGANLLRAILGGFEEPGFRDRVLGLLRTALGHEFAAAMLRQFLVKEVLHRVAIELAVPDGELRATLTASQMIGLVVLRYGIRAEPLASVPLDELVVRVGPVIQWHLLGFPEAKGP